MAFAPFEWLLAGRYLRARRQEGFISVIAWFSLIGIALGVATLIIVMSVMNGFRAELMGRILGLNGHMMVQADLGLLQNSQAIMDQLADVRAIKRMHPLAEGQVMALHAGNAAGAMVRGVPQSALGPETLVGQNIIAGTAQDFGGREGILIGTRLAQRLGVRVGDWLNLIAPQTTATPFGSIPRSVSFPVVGLFEVGMYEYDANFIFMPLELAQTFFRMNDGVTGIEIFFENPEQAQDRAIRAAMLDRLPVGTTLFDWQRANASFFNAIEVERNVMFLILTLIILVAAFNIISSLIMLVKDKGRSIAILRTMGAPRGAIMRVFFITGSSIGMIGTVVGVALGVGFAANIESIRQFLEGLSGRNLFNAEIYFLSKLPARLDYAEVFLVSVMALGLSFLATLYPAWKAARLDPVEALRYE